jgi:death on curing protein
MICFLSEEIVVKMHDQLIQKYGGERGLRDAPLLDSALNQPKLTLHFSDASLCELAATYGFHISENQPFFDGNKRTASAALMLFLRLNGLKIIVSDSEVFDRIFDMANKRITKQQLADWLSSVTREIPSS